VLLLLLPGGAAGAQVDAAGERALAVLRQLGLPPALALTVGPPAAGLKQRAAAKKRAAAALDAQARARALLLGSCGQGRSAAAAVHTTMRRLSSCQGVSRAFRTGRSED